MKQTFPGRHINGIGTPNQPFRNIKATFPEYEISVFGMWNQRFGAATSTFPDYDRLFGSGCEIDVSLADFLVAFCELYVICADFWAVNASDMRYSQTFW